MSHFLLLAVVTEEQSRNPDAVLVERMAPWREDLGAEEYNEEHFKWDGWTIGGRHDGYITGLEIFDENRNLFDHSDDAVLARNRASIADVLDKGRECFAILLPDGRWLDRENTETEKEADYPAWLAIWRGELESYRGHWCIAVDCHS